MCLSLVPEVSDSFLHKIAVSQAMLFHEGFLYGCIDINLSCLVADMSLLSYWGNNTHVDLRCF